MSQKFKIGDNWIIRIQQLQIVERLHKIMSHLFKLTCFKIRSHLFKLTCSWNKVYIEETARNFATKCNEHLKTTGKSLTEVVQHLKENPYHEINSHDPEFLGFSRFSKKRKIMDSLYIQKHDHQDQLLNDNESSVKIFLFNVPTS